MGGLSLLLFWVKKLPTTEKIRSAEADIAIRYLMATWYNIGYMTLKDIHCLPASK